MLRSRTIAVILVSFISCQNNKHASEIDLNNSWRIKLGDSVAYSKVNFRDDDWTNVNLDESLDNQGYENYDGVLWYRYKVVIPSWLKASKHTKKLQFYFGTIDDSDLFYFNGTFVGSNNKYGDSSINDSVSYANVSRLYEMDIKDSRILWDQENLIAIRVHDLGSVGGIQGSAYICASEFNLHRSIKFTIEDGWRFRSGDSAIYASFSYNDSNWSNIAVARNWESQGFFIDGFSWYRVHLKISSKLRRKTYRGTGRLHIFMGKIDDNDQLFLNGFKIGENNRNVTAPARFSDYFRNNGSFSGVNRVYSVSINDKRIRWDKDNVIAVRVFDSGGGGGITESFPYIKAETLEDLILVDRSKFYSINKDNQVDTLVTIYNKDKYRQFNGSFICTAQVTGSNKLIGEKIFRVNIKPADSARVSFSLPYSVDSIRITLSMVDESNVNVFRYKYIIPFILN